MTAKRLYDREGHAHFVTFSCYKRRRLLEPDRHKRIVLGVLNSQLATQCGHCPGFVLMPDHVHAIVWFSAPDQLARFMKQWKQRSSVQVKRHLRTALPAYAARLPATDPIWQARYYDFNLFSDAKIEEKLHYMHQNPVRAGLVADPCDWPWSSARYYERSQGVGVPITRLG